MIGVRDWHIAILFRRGCFGVLRFHIAADDGRERRLLTRENFRDVGDLVNDFLAVLVLFRATIWVVRKRDASPHFAERVDVRGFQRGERNLFCRVRPERVDEKAVILPSHVATLDKIFVDDQLQRRLRLANRFGFFKRAGFLLFIAQVAREKRFAIADAADKNFVAGFEFQFPDDATAGRLLLCDL